MYGMSEKKRLFWEAYNQNKRKRKWACNNLGIRKTNCKTSF